MTQSVRILGFRAALIAALGGIAFTASTTALIHWYGCHRQRGQR
jgi:hypothetical protein